MVEQSQPTIRENFAKQKMPVHSPPTPADEILIIFTLNKIPTINSE
jgi:hypothetical protein